MIAPLTNLTRTDIPFVWDAACEAAFLAAKHASNAPSYATHQKKAYELFCYKTQKPFAYESRKLRPAEVNYTTGDQELFTVVHAFNATCTC
eukprot:987401-Pelagomonas_calceolata.AAC.2